VSGDIMCTAVAFYFLCILILLTAIITLCRKQVFGHVTG